MESEIVIVFISVGSSRSPRCKGREHPETVHDLRSALDALTGGGAPAPRVDDSELDPETLERLRALGYVE